MSSITAEQHAQFAAQWNPDVSCEKIAAIYAEALLAAVDAKKGSLNDVFDGLNTLIDSVFAKYPKFESVLHSPMITPEEKIGIIERVFAKQADPIVLNFLRVLAKHGRLDVLRDIRFQTKNALDKRAGRISVVVTTATQLSKETTQSLIAGLKKMIGGEPIITTKVNAETIGGIAIRVGDTIYDASILSQLKNLRQRMIDRSSSEIQTARERFT